MNNLKHFMSVSVSSFPMLAELHLQATQAPVPPSFCPGNSQQYRLPDRSLAQCPATLWGQSYSGVYFVQHDISMVALGLAALL